MVAAYDDAVRMSFNEGGADCPPIAAEVAELRDTMERFNEGGADCPPIAPQR